MRLTMNACSHSSEDLSTDMRLQTAGRAVRGLFFLSCCTIMAAHKDCVQLNDYRVIADRIAAALCK